jgi:hypothetical protein
MNDEFMHQLYEKPRAEFANALSEHISRLPQPRFAPMIMKKLTFRNAAIALAFLIFLAACVYVVSEKRWNKVGDIWVEVQRTHKVDLTSEEVQPIPGPECLRIEEARKILRFQLHVPTWAPDGFTLDDRICGIDRTSDFAGLYWKGTDEYSGINIMSQNLRIFNMSTQEYEVASPTVWGPVAPGSYEEVEVLGQPAILVHGDWEEPWMTGPMMNRKYEFKWDKKRGLQLHWVDGEVMYHIFTHAQVSAEDLIKMAESAQ